jgi:hypothetical protein
MTARHDGRKRADYVRDEERAWFPVLERTDTWGLTQLFVHRGLEAGIAYRTARFIEAHRDLVDDGLVQTSRSRIRARLRAMGPPTREDELPSRIAIPGYVNSSRQRARSEELADARAAA